MNKRKEKSLPVKTLKQLWAWRALEEGQKGEEGAWAWRGDRTADARRACGGSLWRCPGPSLVPACSVHSVSSSPWQGGAHPRT
jgi:hypothetical protein